MVQPTRTLALASAPRRACVLVNPRAGQGRAGHALEVLEARFDAEGIQATVLPLSRHAAPAAATDPCDTLVAVGGDGTIRRVAEIALGRDVPLGVLPLGTRNHFARDLGVPLDLAAAIRCVAAGHERRIDVGEVNGHLFLNNASIGAYPHVVEERDAARRRGLRRWPATLVALARVVRRRPLLRARLDLDGEALTRTTPFVFVGNNEYAGDLLQVTARERLDDGRLFVYTVRCTDLRGLVRLVWHGLWNRLDQAQDFDTWSAREVTLHLRRAATRVALDGDVLRLATPLVHRIRARALRVLVP